MSPLELLDQVITDYQAHLAAAQPPYRFSTYLVELRDALRRGATIVADVEELAAERIATPGETVPAREALGMPGDADEAQRRARYAAAAEKRKATLAAKKAAKQVADAWGE